MSMDEATAREQAERERGSRDVPPGYRQDTAERQIIELVWDREDAAPVLVRDVRVWLVRYREGVRWVELAVDEDGGGVVRVRRSRAP